MQKKISKLALALTAAAVISGCQSTNPYTGEKEVNKTSKYGGIGAITGAVIGGLVDGGEGALKGAAIGGAAGAGYGLYTDKQETMLRQELQGTGVQIYREGNDLRLVMPSNITFASSEDSVQSSFYPVLDSVSKIFKEYDKNMIEVVGYTDSSGGDQLNIPLSQKRARSVAEYLISQGVSAERISYYGAGSANPKGNNETKEGKALNRRVEINIKPVPQG